MKLLLRWALSAGAFWLVAHYLPGISIAGWKVALILSFLWGLIGFTVKPVLVLLTLPINLLTFGLFTLVINGFLLWLLGGVVKGFEVDTFVHAIIGALALSLVIGVINWFLDVADGDDD
ncbi:MAG: phage holin family protein [Candidatus Moraniibacteriota bacterium]